MRVLTEVFTRKYKCEYMYLLIISFDVGGVCRRT